MEYGYERDLDDAPEFSSYGALSNQQRYDQILLNLHDMFKEKTNYKIVGRSGDEYNDVNSMNVNKDFDKQQFEEILSDVAFALEKIKSELLKFNKDDVLTVEVPVVKKENRYKRDVSNETVINATLTEDVVAEEQTTTETAETVTEKLTVETTTLKIDTPAVKNDTSAVKNDVLRVNNDTHSEISGRRMIPDYKTATSRVKDKLLSYLEDTFIEVEKKIKPLTNIKIALSNDDNYRIGYIIATIDTLEVNLKKLKNDMNLHQHVWDDEKILDLFDRIKATNSVTTSLIESLKKYLPRS